MPIATKAMPTNAVTTTAIRNNDNKDINDNSVLIKTNMHEKFYQQALYYYFQGDYAGALAIINQSKSRLKSIEPITQLFEAGLQVKIGLQEQARQNLRQLIAKQTSTDTELNDTLSTNASLNANETPENLSATKAFKINSQQLLVLALLSLAEQYIEQGEMIQAQHSLASIKQISPRYYQQYHVLSQLAYWPEPPTLLPPMALNQANDTSSTTAQNIKGYSTDLSNVLEQSPYIELNNALRFIEEQNFEQAIILLNQIKSRQWQAPEKSFFQLLFSNDNASATDEKEIAFNKAQEDIQTQAIIDYARLLLAHLYTQQAAYEKVYSELKTFPQQSNYIESALFLYAFSAQKIKQYTIALTLFDLLHKQYPTSTLGWQAGLLIAKQVTEQQGLAPGWQSYQNIESFYLHIIEELSLFEQSFEQSFKQNTDLLAFSTTKSSLNSQNYIDHSQIESNFVNNSAIYQPESIWLKQAMLDQSLNSLYQQLTQVTELLQYCQSLQSKSDEILDIIELNSNRKLRIASAQQALVKASQKYNTYQTLAKQSEYLAVKLSKALNDPKQNGEVFANAQEQDWLERLNKSKASLSYIVEHKEVKNQQTNIQNAQRLNRLERVLAWRLSQTFPERSWQHKQQLDSLEHSLKQLENIQTKVTNLMAESLNERGSSSLQHYSKRQKIAASKIKPLIDNLTQLKAKIVVKIHEKVAYFTQERKAILAEHLLTTRKAMAAVLEQMSVNDNKIEKQLNPEENIKQSVNSKPLLEKQPNKEAAVQKQAITEQNTQSSSLQVQKSKPLTTREQAIIDERAKRQAIKALRKALEKEEPTKIEPSGSVSSNSEPNSKDKSTTAQDPKQNTGGGAL